MATRTSWPGTRAMTSYALTVGILDHTTGELYPSYGVVTPVVLTAKSPA